MKNIVQQFYNFFLKRQKKRNTKLSESNFPDVGRSNIDEIISCDKSVSIAAANIDGNSLSEYDRFNGHRLVTKKLFSIFSITFLRRFSF